MLPWVICVETLALELSGKDGSALGDDGGGTRQWFEAGVKTSNTVQGGRGSVWLFLGWGIYHGALRTRVVSVFHVQLTACLMTDSVPGSHPQAEGMPRPSQEALITLM